MQRTGALGSAAMTLAFLGSSMLSPRVAAEAAGSSVDTAADGLAEIVVTARKTEESLQRVPISISAITGVELEKRSLTDLAAVGQFTPNFSFGQQAQGGNSAGVVYIRGVGQADTLATYDPAVGVYLDGVYLGRMQSNDLDMLDVQRVEVLRGPQGTLFGKNTSGGAVNIISRQPDASDGPSGRVQLTGGNFGRFDALAEINLPLATDVAALLLSGSRQKQDGYGRRVGGGDAGSVNRESGRAALLLKPTANFSATLAVDGLTYDESNAVMDLVYIDPTAGPVAALNAFTPFKYDSRYYGPNPRTSYGTGPNSSRGTVGGVSATVDYNIEWATIKSISAYRVNNIHNDLDPDNSPVTLIDQFQSVRQHQFSQEVQATGKSFEDRLDSVLGVYYFREFARDDSSYNLLTPLLGNTAGFTQGDDVLNSSIAVYGQGTYKLTDKLRFTAGLRFTHDDKEVVRSRPQYPTGVPLQPTLTKSLDSNDLSPRLGFDYQWTPAVMTYISAAKGYKAGGFNGRASLVSDFNEFKEETVRTYEVGLRSDFLDRRVRFNATAFYSSYSDLQLQINGSTDVNGAPTPFVIVTNIPRSRITGGEIELDVVPLSGLTLSTGLGLIDARYASLPANPEFEAAGLITLNSRFQNTPKTSATFAAEHSLPLTDAFVSTTRLDYAYKSTIFYDPSNSAVLREGGYGLLNARWTVEYLPARLSVALFGTNLTDKRYFVGGYNDATTPNPGLGFAFTDVAPPREYGVTVQWRF